MVTKCLNHITRIASPPTPLHEWRGVKRRDTGLAGLYSVAELFTLFAYIPPSMLVRLQLPDGARDERRSFLHIVKRRLGEIEPHGRGA